MKSQLRPELRPIFDAVMTAHDFDDLLGGAWFQVLKDTAEEFGKSHRLKNWGGGANDAVHEYLRDKDETLIRLRIPNRTARSAEGINQDSRYCNHRHSTTLTTNMLTKEILIYPFTTTKIHDLIGTVTSTTTLHRR